MPQIVGTPNADKGLAAALEVQVREAAVPTTVTSDGIDRYPQEVESAVYFCTLDALTNVANYAEATHAAVTLAHDNGCLEFTVIEDGKGFDATSTHYGTRLIHPRAAIDAREAGPRWPSNSSGLLGGPP